MLHSLTIQDFVIVDQLHLEFSQGMSVLSGETGAGKSILIDALSLCLGARADASQVREGCDKAIVTAIFECTPAAHSILTEQGIETDQNELHLRRVIESNGRSKAFVNGTPVPVGTLKQLSETLIDIHGQHAFQTITKLTEQLRLIDDFGQHQNTLVEVRCAYQTLQLAEKALKAAQEGQEERETRLQNLQWRLDALQKISPKADQWETLSQEHDRLSHSAELLEGTQHASNVLTQNDNALLDELTHLIDRLTQLSIRDAKLSPIVKNLSEGEILIREASYDLSDYLKHTDLDPESLAEVETQLTLWHDTARKLRIPPESMHTAWEQAQSELGQLEAGSNIAELEKNVQKTKASYEQIASTLTQLRKKAASQLSKQVTESMQTLSMQGGSFTVQLMQGAPSSTGSDHLEFLVAGHPGVTPQPIQKVASGGELARISLAITVNTVESTAVPSLIFDEVDSGIGGAVAETVGKYLRQLASNKQVLCVTHLPQVAAQGHHHYQVSKDISNGKTRSTIKQLAAEERVQEVARMLGGQVITTATKTTAQEMIMSAG